MKRSEIIRKLAEARVNLRLARVDKDYSKADIKSLEKVVDTYEHLLDMDTLRK